MWARPYRDCHDEPLSGVLRIGNKTVWGSALGSRTQGVICPGAGGFRCIALPGNAAVRGNANITDAEIRAAVDDMITLVNPWRKELS